MTTFALCVCLVVLIFCAMTVALKVNPDELNTITAVGVVTLVIVLIISFIKVIDLLGKVQQCGLD